jgi:hypothetical protein
VPSEANREHSEAGSGGDMPSAHANKPRTVRQRGGGSDSENGSGVCKNHSYGCVLVHNEEVITTIVGAPILAFTAHEDHCYFYKESSV